MFERFTTDARRVVVLAQEEARELRSERIEVGHLLLALASNAPMASVMAEFGCPVAELRERVARGTDAAMDAEALASLGIDLEQVRAAVESHFGEGALDRPARRWRGGHIPFSKNAKKVLECALQEAIRLGHRRLVAWHVLLGAAWAESATLDDLLGRQGAHERLRALALRELDERAA